MKRKPKAKFRVGAEVMYKAYTWQRVYIISLVWRKHLTTGRSQWFYQIAKRLDGSIPWGWTNGSKLRPLTARERDGR